MTNDMIERVARAIGAAADEFSDARKVLEAAGGEPESFIQKKLARAAIAAMREPTNRMISAGDFVPYPQGIWERMIDAALNEGGDKP